MRKIEQDMLNAIKARSTWTSSNTQVIKGESGILSVRLHGHTIAWVHPDGTVEVNKAVFYNWPTRTTTSRLRALGVSASISKGAPCIDGKPLSIGESKGTISIRN